MYSVCKVCIYSHFNNRVTRDAVCPKENCNISLGAMPLSKVIFDRNVQSFVDKLVPVKKAV